MIHFAHFLRLCKLESKSHKQEGTMVRKWAYAVVAIALDFVVLCPANAQPVRFLSASGVDDCLGRANGLVVQAGNTSFGPDANRTERAERPPFGPVTRGNVLELVSFVVVVELALAAITAVACLLVLAIAGICVTIENRRRLKILQPFLPERLALHPVRKTSEITSKVASG
jgi:hypothetical protein